MKSLHRQRGYLLITVVVTLFLIAAIATLMTRDSAINANTAGTEIETTRANLVAEAGMQHALWRAANNVCMGNVTIASTALGADTYSATSTGASTGTAYVLLADQDAWIRNDNPDTNNGTASANHVKFGSGDVEQVLTRFDLSTLPANARIQSAVAWFHLKSGQSHPEGPISVHEILATWDETSVTWNTFAGAYNSAPLAVIRTQSDGDVWVAINLTGLVQSWVNGQPNNGILFNSVAEGLHTQYTAREDGVNPPRLDVVVGGGAASPITIQVAGVLDTGNERHLTRYDVPVYQKLTGWETTSAAGIGKDAMIRQSQATWNHGAAELMSVRDTAGNPDDVALLHFDLSAVPQGARVANATLSLYQTDASTPGGAVHVHRVTRAWDEGSETGGVGPGVTWDEARAGVNWSSAGGDFVVTNTSELDVPPGTAGWVDTDVSGLLNDWSRGTFANFGTTLVPATTDLDVTFATGENTDTTLHPRLSIEFACPCGDACLPPQGVGNVLMVIGNSPGSPSDAEISMREYLESWGYAVTLIQDDDSQGNFDAAVASNDVVFVSETVSGNNVGTKLTNSPKGVVTAERNLVDELGIATGNTTSVGDTIDVVDASHYITSLFPPASLQLKSERTELVAVSGTVSPDAAILANASGAGGIVAVDAGGLSATGGTLSGRRVLIPIGEGNVSWDYLTGAGRLIVQRALHWAADLKPNAPEGAGLWLSTLDDVSSSGAPGLDAWTDGEIIAFTDADLTFEPSTTGSFSSVLNLDDFAGDADIDAIHYVGTALTVGTTSTVDLKPGDVLLSTADNETLSSSSTLSVNDEDVFVFRPDTPGDYSAGTFIFLLDGSQLHSEADTVGISLVEKDTIVGNGGLSQGYFIMAVSNRRDVIGVRTENVGLDTTQASIGEFIDGPSLSFGSEIRGLDLAEDELVIGGHTIKSGAILVTLNNDDTGGVGDNLIPALSEDVFYLDVVEVGPNPIADATLLFEGAEVGLSGSAEHLQALSLTGTASGSPPPPATALLFVVGNESNLTAEELAHQTLIESWGYTVQIIDDDASQAEFDAAAAANDVAFITNDITASRLNTKLVDATIGVVTSEVNLSDEFGMASSVGWESGTVVEINDNTHYITSPFATGPLEILSASESLAYVTGSLSPDLDTLASSSSGYGIVSLNAGSLTLGFLPAAGRRVQLPWGGNGFNPKTLTPEGRTILERALEWGRGEGDDGGSGGGGGGGGVSGPYVELHAPWRATSSDTWETVDLSSYGVPADAVVEVAVINDSTSAQRWGGVRATGSSLDRRFQLHEAESNGVDAVTMHVQADGASRIQHYSDNTGDVSFVLLGYWTGVAYVERFAAFSAGGSESWREHDFAGDGVGPNQIAEVVITNTNTSAERFGGVRMSGSGMLRYFPIHEAESGGVDTVTLMVTTDDWAIAEVFAGSNSDIEFYVVGYWDTPPGSYNELGAVHGQVSASSTWQPLDLGALGVAADSVARVVLSNEGTSAEQHMGVRGVGSSLDRLLELQEAEAGGSDTAAMHVVVDGNGRVEAYSEAAGADRYFYPTGWWTLN